MDIFDRIKAYKGPLGQHAEASHGYFTFPKLESPIANRMQFRGKDGPTNVLSFPSGEHADNHLGDIALAHGVVAREAAARASFRYLLT